MSNINFLKILKSRTLVLYVVVFLLILAASLKLTFSSHNNVFAQTQTDPTTSFGLQLDHNTPFPNVGGIFNLQVVVRSDVESSNLFSAKITFPVDKLAVTSIDSTNNTFITEPVESNFSNTTGTINIVGGHSGGYRTNSTDFPSNMATITFTRIASGSATLQFIPSTLTDVNKTAIFSNTTNQNILASSPALVLVDGSINPLDTNNPTSTPTPTPTDTPCQSNCGGGSAPSNPSNPSTPPSNPPPATQGDLDGSSRVDGIDLSILLRDWNTGTVQADIDHNGIVDGIDLSILLRNWSF